MTTEKGKRAAYTLEFKLEAVRLVQGGQAKAVTAFSGTSERSARSPVVVMRAKLSMRARCITSSRVSRRPSSLARSRSRYGDGAQIL